MVGKFTAVVKLTRVYEKEIRVGYTPTIFCHTCSFPGRFSALLTKFDGKVKHPDPKSLKKNDMGEVEIVPKWGVFVETFKEMPPLGRFVVEDNKLVCGYGTVQSVTPIPSNLKGGGNANFLKQHLYEIKGRNK